MSEIVVSLPSKLTLISHVEELGIDKLALDGVAVCRLRVSDCQFATPTPLMLFAVRFKRLMASYPRVKYVLSSRDSNFRGYASHIGFFKFLGFPIGNAPGEAIGSTRYVPIETIDIKAFSDGLVGRPIGSLVLPISQRLAGVLSQSSAGSLFELFEYTFREIIRNALEHSRGTSLLYCGQFWPMKNLAEIVVLDDGVGVAETLYTNEYIKCTSNREALKFAILPGVSRVSRAERAVQDEHWGNSGFGLYLTSRICSEGGLFRVLSGSSALTLANGVRTEHDWRYTGTCIQLRFSTRNAGARVERIEDIIGEGKEEWKEIVGDYPISASAASRMLSSHFGRRS